VDVILLDGPNLDDRTPKEGLTPAVGGPRVLHSHPVSTRYYTRAVIDHFRNPRNQRSLSSPDGEGRAINHACSDIVRIFIQVDGDSLVDCSFQAQGCAACIAAASMTTELAKNLPLEEARTFDKDVVIDALGGLPESKVQCSVIAPEALRAAVRSYDAASS
jgi:nitrogen fixation protein NifU and related proteins